MAGLRNRWDNWEPVAQWIVPGVLFPVKEGYIFRVLAALEHEIRVAVVEMERAAAKDGLCKTGKDDAYPP